MSTSNHPPIRAAGLALGVAEAAVGPASMYAALWPRGITSLPLPQPALYLVFLLGWVALRTLVLYLFARRCVRGGEAASPPLNRDDEVRRLGAAVWVQVILSWLPAASLLWWLHDTQGTHGGPFVSVAVVGLLACAFVPSAAAVVLLPPTWRILVTGTPGFAPAELLETALARPSLLIHQSLLVHSVLTIMFRSQAFLFAGFPEFSFLSIPLSFMAAVFDIRLVSVSLLARSTPVQTP